MNLFKNASLSSWEKQKKYTGHFLFMTPWPSKYLLTKFNLKPYSKLKIKQFSSTYRAYKHKNKTHII